MQHIVPIGEWHGYINIWGDCNARTPIGEWHGSIQYCNAAPL